MSRPDEIGARDAQSRKDEARLDIAAPERAQPRDVADKLERRTPGVQRPVDVQAETGTVGRDMARHPLLEEGAERWKPVGGAGEAGRHGVAPTGGQEARLARRN